MKPQKAIAIKELYNVLYNCTTTVLSDVRSQGAGEPVPTKELSYVCLLADIYISYSVDGELRTGCRPICSDRIQGRKEMAIFGQLKHYTAECNRDF